MKQTPKAVLYCRVSTEDQAENGTSLEAQELACLRQAAEMGAQVVATHRDEGVSGRLYMTREGVQKALCNVEAGKANLLIVYSISRLSRDVEHQQAIKKRVERAGGRLIVCDMPMEDTEEGELMFGISGTFAQYERRLIRKRTMAGSRRVAEKGIQPVRGQRPYGYDLLTQADVFAGRAAPGEVGTYRVRETEARIVEEMYCRYARGESLRSIGLWLTRTDTPSPKGVKWYPETCRVILTNPIYKGQATYGRKQSVWDEDRAAANGGKHACFQKRRTQPLYFIPAPAIVSVEVWNEVQARFAENRRLKSGNPGRVYLLSTLARCPFCGRGLSGKNCHGTLYYRCNGGGANLHAERLHPARTVESYVKQAVLQAAAKPHNIAAAFAAWERCERAKVSVGDEAERLRRELEEVAEQEKAAAQAQIEAITKGRPTAVYEALLDDLDRRRKEIDARLTMLETQPPDTDTKRAVVTAQEAVAVLAKVLSAEDVLSTQERREVIAGAVLRIDLLPDGVDLTLRPGFGETVNLCQD